MGLDWHVLAFPAKADEMQARNLKGGEREPIHLTFQPVLVVMLDGGFTRQARSSFEVFSISASAPR